MEANPPQAARLQSRRRHYATASDPNPRLSIQFQPRLGMSLIVSSIAGSLLGVTHGMRSARLRFQAENAHRLPTTPTGWYLYHKSKNYISMLGGIKEGSKMGFKVAVGVGIYVMCEEGIDRLRGRRDAGSSVVAGGAVAGGWCLWSEYLAQLICPRIETLY